MNLDIRNGYLQGSDLKREVFVEPPPEYKKEGMIWKLKKAANGLYDGGRHLYLKIDEVLKELGCTKVTGDDAMYTCHDETKKLIGIVSLYGWNSPGCTSLLDECHQNVCTLGLLTRSVLIEIAWGFLRLVRNCHWTDDIKKYQ